MKLSQGRFGLEIRKTFFPQGVVEPWKRLLREVIAAPSPKEFKKCLDNILRYMVGFLGCPVKDQELGSMILMGPFQLSTFYDSMISLLFFSPITL